MGRVTAEITVENFNDLALADAGVKPPGEVRAVTIPDALVDTGATMLALPARTVAALGLKDLQTKIIRTASGTAEAGIHAAVRLTILGRQCVMDVMSVPDGVPALVGQLPLERLDFVVDPVRRELTGNPAHGGEHVLEAYAASPAAPAA